MFDISTVKCIGFMCSICETAIIHGGSKGCCSDCELYSAMTCKDCIYYNHNNDDKDGEYNECGY